MTNEELIKVIQAAERGEKIEVRTIGTDMWEPKVIVTRWNTRDYEYRIVNPKPKLVPHWPVICCYENGNYYLSDRLFHDEQTAQEMLSGFFRLATEYPEVLLEVKE